MILSIKRVPTVVPTTKRKRRRKALAMQLAAAVIASGAAAFQVVSYLNYFCAEFKILGFFLYINLVVLMGFTGIFLIGLGAKLPLYAFTKMGNVVGEKGSFDTENKKPPVNFLDSLLLGEWEDRMQRGLFRYDVTACDSWEYGFIAQLNEGRHLKKRPTEFRVDKVLQPFDENKFNFTKVGQEEVLFQFEASEDNEVQFFPNEPIDVDNSPSVVAINVSPIEYGHVLLIPRILECLPQRIDRESFLLALYMAVEAGNPYFRLEKAPSKKITTTTGGVKISDILNYPVRGLVFEGGNTLEDLSNVVSDSCICLQENNIPYNVLIADCGKRIFLFPQCYAEKQALGEVSSELLDTQVNPAVGRSVDICEGTYLKLFVIEEEIVTPPMEDESDVAPQSHEDMDGLKGSQPAMVPA
ncbi:UNVERIFIED_CONTAM: GDP-L-galactose phosphorylase 1 [Sesamum latifolium]|uniref:GDP-L-galactose phosphorylase 1 n=1 Tax=Sesamum latifolium TaxID=2727402 RepID=A0AAW2TR53_9LAMI